MTIEPDRIMAHTKINTHVAQGIASLYRQFKTKPLIVALVTAYLNRIQEIEDAFWDLLTSTLDTAVGAALDQIGAILAFPRGTLSDDDDYRAILKAIVRARQSSGTDEDFFAVLKLALGDSFSYSFEAGNASVLITPHAPLPVNAAALMVVLRATAAAGIQLQLIDPPASESNLFTFSSEPFREETSSTKGFGDTAQTTGGVLTGVLE